MNRFLMVIVVTLLFGAMGTKAEISDNSTDNPRKIPDSITVSANRFPTTLTTNASTVTVLTETDIKNSNATKVSELLQSVPGLAVVTSGGLGKQTSVFIRGTNSNHTLVIIDGVEMNNPSSPSTSYDFAHLNVDNIQRVEILRGSQSILYGSEAIGGVINIYTKRGFGKPTIELSTQAGTYNSYFQSATIAGSASSLDYSLNFSRKDFKGFSAASENVGGIENDGYENSEASLALGLQATDNIELVYSGKYFDATADADKTFFVYDDPNYTVQTKAKISSLTIRTLKQHNFFNPTLQLSYANQQLLNVDEKDPDHGSDASDLDSESNKLKLSFLNQLFINENSTTLFGIEYETEDYKSTSVNTFYDYFSLTEMTTTTIVDKVDADIISLFATEQYKFNNLTLSAGTRFDSHKDFGSVVTYRFTSAFKIPNTGTTLKGTLSSGFKTPSLFQLYDLNYGNKELDPEESRSWELGFTHHTADNQLTFGGTYFRIDITNLIGFDPMTYQSINVGEIDAQGVEAFAQFSLNNSNLRFDYTYTESIDKETDLQLIRRPKHMFAYSLNQKISEQINMQFLMRTTGKRFDNDFSTYPSDRVELEGYTIVNLGIDYNLNSFVTLKGTVDNLFDESYTEVLTFATPGRTAFIGLDLTL
ncbi:MAG: TonB-dependent receptor [Calditrichaeota bacterium]|nr:MAG: TonB-dependent receptor [Calditrichota bacterium]